MIEVKNLTKYYGTFAAVRDITFTVEQGEILGFLGPNAAGKTTTMRVLTCFFPPSSGTVTVAGYDVIKNPLSVRQRMGYLPENVPLYTDMRVTTYLEFVARIKDVPARDRKLRVNKVISDCGLNSVANRLISQLSKGYRQRVGLAQALINDPEVLILDEPTIGLDPKQITEIRQLIKDLAGKRTVILSSHILPEVSMICQRVVIINEGQLVAVDTPQNLITKLETTRKIIVQVDGPEQEILTDFTHTTGVTNVQVQNRDNTVSSVATYLIESEKDLDLRRMIAQTITSRGWGLLELRGVTLSLEDVFIKLVTKE